MQQPPSRRLRRLVPLGLTGAFVVLALVVFGFSPRSTGQDAQNSLVRDADSARQSVLFLLQSDKDFLELLAGLIARGDFNERAFRQNASSYVASHPELINITWNDADFVIRWAAPEEPNRNVVGLRLDLPEPSRASHLARDTQQAMYTRPFVVIQGSPAFEIYLPVFRDGKFLGTVSGVYAVQNLLARSIPPRLREQYQVGLVEQ